MSSHLEDDIKERIAETLHIYKGTRKQRNNGGDGRADGASEGEVPPDEDVGKDTKTMETEYGTCAAPSAGTAAKPSKTKRDNSAPWRDGGHARQPKTEDSSSEAETGQTNGAASRAGGGGRAKQAMLKYG